MEGFFTKTQTKSTTRPDGKQLSCNTCGLYKGCHTPHMKPFGEFAKQIMCIGENPEELDDIRGKQWQGKAGTFLRKTFEQYGIDLFKDCVHINAVNCRVVDESGKNRRLKPFEIDCCKRSVLGYIAEYKPKVIILFGGSALQSIIGGRWKKDLGTITKWRGHTIPDQEFKAWICPTMHPVFVLKEDKPEVEKVWNQDLANIFNLLKTQVVFPVNKEPVIHYLSENELGQLRKIKSGKIAFDYETTGLKPHSKGHSIVCMSIAVSADEVYSFMMPTNKALQQPIIELLENPNVGKICHNLKYELAWTFNCLRGTVVQNWICDTMLKAHLLDNRTGVTGLKFQTAIHFGIFDYSSEVTPYLQASEGVESEKGANGINQLLKYVRTPENAQKVLKYCSLDSVYTYRLSLLQDKQFEQLLLPF
jgi:uracil-DNA glycosylase family 4